MSESGLTHWCDFCQCYHSSSSCYHPRANRYADLIAENTLLQAKLDDLEVARVADQAEYKSELDALQTKLERAKKYLRESYSLYRISLEEALKLIEEA